MRDVKFPAGSAPAALASSAAAGGLANGEGDVVEDGAMR